MKKEIKANHPFEKMVVSRDQALKDAESGRLGALIERPGNPSRFKIGNLSDIPEGEAISYYRAIETNVWWSSDREFGSRNGHLQFPDLARIRRLKDLLEHHERSQHFQARSKAIQD